MIKGIAKTNISTGCAVKQVGTTRIYVGQILKPWTWLKWERLPVIEPVRVDHLAIIRGVIEP